MTYTDAQIRAMTPEQRALVAKHYRLQNELLALQISALKARDVSDEPRDEQGQWTETGANLSDSESPDRWEGEKHAKLANGTIVKVHGYSPAGAYGDKPVFHVSKLGGTYGTHMITDAKEVVRK